MCDRWLDDFDAFMEDMGLRPPDMTLERMDVNGDYDPFNCVWASVYDQSRNKRRNRYLTYEGRTMIIEDWAKEIGHRSTVIASRIERGFPIEKILSKDRLINVPKHGTISMYMSRKCRCDLCRKANSEYIKANRHRFPSMSKEYRKAAYERRK